MFPVDVPLIIIELAELALNEPKIVIFPFIVNELFVLIVKVAFALIVKFPARASVPELMIGELRTLGIATYVEFVGIPLSQFPSKFQVELIAPVQFEVLIVNASCE